MKEIIKILLGISPNKILKDKGVKIGNNVGLVMYPYKWSLPLVGSEPYLISIGDNTTISFGCTFVTHDGAVSVVRRTEKYKNVIKFGYITIGKNCFIGCNTTIMPNVSIGDNSIIGANSLVTKSVPENQVWAGNPAKFICTTEEYAEKMLKNTPQYNVENLKINFREESMNIAELYKNKM